VTTPHLLLERAGPVSWVRLNRPDLRNALDDETIRELTAWAEAAAGDATIRAAVLTGTGRIFCAGADLAWMARAAAFSHPENVRDARAGARLFGLLDALPFPVIGRVQGAAMGGGAGLAAVCDIVVADEGTTFGFTEVKLGIIPAMISPYVVAKIGRSAARELFLSGRRFDAAHAKAIGLVHAVVPASDLDATVDSYLNDVLAAGPEAIAAAKALIRRVWKADPAEVAEMTAHAIAERRVSEEGHEGLTAFLEKRRARWNVSPGSDR